MATTKPPTRKASRDAIDEYLWSRKPKPYRNITEEVRRLAAREQLRTRMPWYAAIGGGCLVVLAIVVVALLNSRQESNPAFTDTSSWELDVQAERPIVEESRTNPTQEEWQLLDQAASHARQHGSQHLASTGGMSEAKRREIYLAMSYAIHAAELRGDNTYDYRPEISRRYGITINQVNAIALEGVEKRWPVE